MKSYCRKGAYTPGIKTVDQPVVLDVLDGGDVVYGFGGVGLVERDVLVGGFDSRQRTAAASRVGFWQ